MRPVTTPTLSVEDLSVEFKTTEGTARAVNGVSFELYPQETLGIVGESGSGKSVTVLSLLGLVPQPPARVTGGRAIFQGEDLLALEEQDLRRIRGRDIGVVFQDPNTSLNPVWTIGYQVVEAIRAHDRQVHGIDARKRAADLLARVGISDPKSRLDQYPHEFSGGMRQRVGIAIAVANSPQILVADEPTTALDVTTQAQVLGLLRLAQQETGASTIIITHDLGVVAELADRVAVMYAGTIVEVGDVDTIFHTPRHPYTIGLLRSLPRADVDEQLVPIPGDPPDATIQPPGCSFRPRCALHRSRQLCEETAPSLYRISTTHRSACHFHQELATGAGGHQAEPGQAGPVGRLA